MDWGALIPCCCDFMKLRLPKVKKKVTSDTKPSPRNIAKRLLMGYKSKNMKRPGKRRPQEFPEGYGPPLPITQKLNIELEQKAAREDKGLFEEIKSNEGIMLPTGKNILPGAKFDILNDSEELRSINMKYPLIPQQPTENEQVMAYANIRWDNNLGSLLYNVVEPKLSPEDMKLVEEIKKDIEDRLDVDFSKLGDVRAKKLLSDEIKNTLANFPSVSMSKVPAIQYNIEKEIFGLGVIEPLMKDPEIEDISCDGVNIPIYIYHRNPKFGPLRTTLSFSDSTELDRFILKLAQKCGKSISVADPLLDAALPDGSRVQCTMGTDIARRGSNFTIRKFTSYPLTPTHMMHYKAVDSMQLAYLWLAIENGKSILISGGTATGKTSMLNALSLFIRPNLKILSIEDTPELRLPHTHWIPEVARSPLSVKGKLGEVTLFDLLKSSLRQRPDYLVVGEVRGKEAFVLFQQMATGHPSLATIHAASLTQLIDRLVTPPISLPPALIENVDIIIFLQRVKVNGKSTRRATEIIEIIGFEKDRPISAKIFEWTAAKDKFISESRSKVLQSVARMSGLEENTVQAEILRRKKVLEWMLQSEVYDYNEVGRIVSEYYLNPEKLMTLIEDSA